MRVSRWAMALMGFCFTVSAGAQTLTMPTIYGFLNKEVRWVDQDVDNKTTGVAITDVDGFESRFGFFGDHPWEEHKFLYRLEVGFNSNLDGGATEDRIRVRLAQGTFQTKWGSLTFGQAWLPSAFWLLKFDPFITTGMQSWSLDTSYVAGSDGGALRGLGYSMMLFSDQLSYATPTYNGFQYVITHDQRAQNSNFNTGTVKQQNYEHMLTYDNGPDASTKVRAMLTHTDEYYSYPGQKRDINTLAVAVNHGLFGVQLSAGTEKNDIDSGATAVDYSRKFVGVTYQLSEQAQLAATYSSLDKGENPGFENQIAAGMKYMITPKIRWTILYGRYVVDEEGTNTIDTDLDTVADEDKNSAHIVTTGIKLDF